MEPVQIAILILRVLISIYGQAYNPQNDFFLLKENSQENLVIVGNFKGVKEVTICDSELYDNCGIESKQRIILLGQTQILIQLKPYPFKFYESFYLHTLDKKGKPTHPYGHRMLMSIYYDRVYVLI